MTLYSPGRGLFQVGVGCFELIALAGDCLRFRTWPLGRRYFSSFLLQALYQCVNMLMHVISAFNVNLL